jgi:nucleoside-diphosphate-sugar epimerase
MTVLVTGGAGFIGSNLVDELLTQGMEVRVLDDFSEGRPENLLRWKRDPRLEVIRGSILDFDIVRRACDHVSCVFHLAADSRIQTGISDPRHAIETNVLGTTNVAEASRQGGVRRIVYSASSSAYGRKSDVYAYLEAGGLHEGLPTDCLNPYSVSKKAGEDVMDVYNRLYGLSTVSLRYFNVYGPRHQEEGRYATVIAIFRRQLRLGQRMTIVGDGSQRRDFTFVGDVVRANMFAMMNLEATGVFNIGSGRNYSISELAALIESRHSSAQLSSVLNVEYLPPRLGEANVTLADITKAKEVLGWSPLVSLPQGLEVIDAYERKMGSGNSGIVLVSQ